MRAEALCLAKKNILKFFSVIVIPFTKAQQEELFPNFSDSLKAHEMPQDFPLELSQKTSSFLPSPFHNTVVASYLCCRHVTNIS
jgi:hypothetical protein